MTVVVGVLTETAAKETRVAVVPEIATKLMAATIWPPEKLRKTASRPTGNNIAPPAPCRIRDNTNSVSVCEAAHSSEPTINSKMAEKYTLRVPSRSASQPDAGISIAMVSE